MPASTQWQDFTEVLGAAAFAAAGAVFVSLVTVPTRDPTRGPICGANLKQMGLAMLLYTQDFHGTLPRPWFGRDAGPSNATASYKWMDALFPYVKDQRVFVCPADISTRIYRFRDGKNYGSYLFNDAYFASGDEFTPPSGQKLARIADANTAVLMCGGSPAFRFGWPNVGSAPALEEDRFGEVRFLHPRSGSPGTMTLMIAGNAVGYRPEQILWARKINGQSVYTGLTIESDSGDGVE